MAAFTYLGYTGQQRCCCWNSLEVFNRLLEII